MEEYMSTKEEIFTSLGDKENNYEVSNFGRVYTHRTQKFCALVRNKHFSITIDRYPLLMPPERVMVHAFYNVPLDRKVLARPIDSTKITHLSNIRLTKSSFVPINWNKALNERITQTLPPEGSLEPFSKSKPRAVSVDQQSTNEPSDVESVSTVEQHPEVSREPKEMDIRLGSVQVSKKFQSKAEYDQVRNYILKMLM